MSESSVVNAVIEHFGVTIQAQPWAQERLTEPERDTAVNELQKRIENANPGEVGYDLQHYFKGVRMDAACQRSALREACMELVGIPDRVDN